MSIFILAEAPVITSGIIESPNTGEYFEKDALLEMIDPLRSDPELST
jgi:hypothetical protein